MKHKARRLGFVKLPRPTRILPLCLFFLVLVSTSSLWYSERDPEEPQDHQSYGTLRGHGISRAFRGTPRSTLDLRNATLGFERIFVLSNPYHLGHLDNFVSLAAAVGIDAEIRNGIRGEDVQKHTIPTTRDMLWTERDRNDLVGAWRSHLNAVREAVNRKSTTTFIVEDDIDWDVNLRFQLELFAQASQYITVVPNGLMSWSPYGDDWDVLWLGHCGSRIQSNDLRRFIVENDATVPIPRRRLNKFPETVDTLHEGYDNSTRIMFKADAARCPYAYALSYRGARRILHSLTNMREFKPYDVALSDLCADSATFKCLSVFPQIFDRYAAVNLSPDLSKPTISGLQTSNIVYSARLNMIRLLAGNTENFARQFSEDPELTGPTQTRTLGRD